ncbi:MAG: tRNA pseudouridine(38-40) synthase TruA [Balneolia bacterium]|nr:tRNA pseudouridine(38-40) synthase TruA [Balneolia bacterium]
MAPGYVRYKMELSYNGTNYAGWQVQPNAVTVQQKLEEALLILFKREIRVQGSGRTDAGVHARCQVAHFDLNNDESPDLYRTVRSLNGILPSDIVVLSIEPAKADFNARFDATYRTYHYYFSSVHQPLHHETTGVWWQELDVSAMKTCVSMFKGDIDCRTFTPFDPELPHHRCFFFDGSVIGPDADGRYCFEITANRFLRSVVRSVMGTLIEVGKGRIDIDMFSDMLKNPDREKAGSTAPAKGLVLHEVGYDDLWILPDDLPE